MCILVGEIDTFRSDTRKENVLKVQALDHNTRRVHVHRCNYGQHAVDMSEVEYAEIFLRYDGAREHRPDSYLVKSCSLAITSIHFTK